jgi:hypothetical protein
VFAFAFVIVIGLCEGRARADGLPAAGSVLRASAYALPVGCSAVTGSYHVAYMLYEEGAPRRWRTAAYVCGGLSIGVGTYVLIDGGGESTGRTVLGIIPLVVGSYAILTAWFVGAPDDIVGPQASHLTPWFGKDSAGLAWGTTF